MKIENIRIPDDTKWIFVVGENYHDNTEFLHSIATQLKGRMFKDIEEGLHPNTVIAKVKRLTEIYKDTICIATTNSPIPFLAVPPETEVFEVIRRKGKLKIKQVTVDFTRLTPNAILISPVFNFFHIESAYKKYEDDTIYVSNDFFSDPEVQKLWDEIRREYEDD